MYITGEPIIAHWSTFNFPTSDVSMILGQIAHLFPEWIGSVVKYCMEWLFLWRKVENVVGRIAQFAAAPKADMYRLSRVGGGAQCSAAWPVANTSQKRPETWSDIGLLCSGLFAKTRIDGDSESSTTMLTECLDNEQQPRQRIWLSLDARALI